jgi:hypothetical protein
VALRAAVAFVVDRGLDCGASRNVAGRGNVNEFEWADLLRPERLVPVAFGAQALGSQCIAVPDSAAPSSSVASPLRSQPW